MSGRPTLFTLADQCADLFAAEDRCQFTLAYALRARLHAHDGQRRARMIPSIFDLPLDIYNVTKGKDNAA